MSDEIKRHEWKDDQGIRFVVERDDYIRDEHALLSVYRFEILNLASQLAAERERADTLTPKDRVYPCGCVTCVCPEELERCQGCGARGCGQPGMPTEHAPGGKPETIAALRERAEKLRTKLDYEKTHHLSAHEAWVERAEKAEAERDGLRIQLGAWHSIFGTTQLTHASSRLETAESKRDQLKRELAEAEKAILAILLDMNEDGTDESGGKEASIIQSDFDRWKELPGVSRALDRAKEGT